MEQKQPSTKRKLIVVFGTLAQILICLWLLIGALIHRARDSKDSGSFTQPTQTAIPEPLAYWPMEGNTLDSMRSQHDGTVQGEDAPVYISGKVGKAILFPHNVSNDSCHVVVGNVFTPTFSVSTWVYVEAATANQIIQKAWLDKGFYVGLKNDRTVSFWIDNHPVDSTVTYPLKEWFHIVCTYDGSAMRIYLNGKTCGVGKQTHITNPTFGDETRLVFRWPKHEGGFALDEVAFYDRALTPDEVELCYLATDNPLLHETN